MEQNQIRNFYHHLFNLIFLLTRHSPVSQIIFWNWNHVINREMQAEKVFWHVILHSYLCNVFCQFFCQNRNRKQLMFFHMPCKVWCKVFDVKFVITIKKINLIIFSRVEGSESGSHLSSGSAGFSTEGRSKSWNRVSSPRSERRASIQGSWVWLKYPSYCFMWLKVQGLDCMTASGFKPI